MLFRTLQLAPLVQVAGPLEVCKTGIIGRGMAGGRGSGSLKTKLRIRRGFWLDGFFAAHAASL